jgi:tellurite resistance protein TerC
MRQAFMETSTPFWIIFNAFILAMLWVDLKVFHKDAHEVKLREALGWSALWLSLSFVFGGGLFLLATPEKSLEFLAGYLVEKSLSIDNIFIFSVIFNTFSIPLKYQHRVLFWGILSALVLRGLMIWGGIEIMARFHWIIYIMGAFLILTGVKTFFLTPKEVDLASHPVLTFLKRYIPLTATLDGQAFFTRKAKRLYGTPLLAVLILIEVSDIIFAIDSIPAIFAITMDPFIVYTSNVFAILGLRSLYFLLADAIERFTYLRPAVALILCFVGIKMVAMDIYKIPVGWSLLVILSILGGSILLSVLHRSRQCR